MNNINKYNDKIFEQIKHIDKEGYEYWEAREFQKVLDKAMIACKLSNNNSNYQFV